MFLLPLIASIIFQTCTGPIVTFERFDQPLVNLRDGYCMQTPDGYLYEIPGMISDSFYRVPAPQFFSTRALWMNEGVMERSAEYNNVRLDDVAGGIALMSCEDVGKHAWVRSDAAHEWLPVRVADCVQQPHYYFHVIWSQSGLELSHALAERMGVLGYNDEGGIGAWDFQVCVTDGSPNEVCYGEPITFREWFFDNVRYYG